MWTIFRFQVFQFQSYKKYPKQVSRVRQGSIQSRLVKDLNRIQKQIKSQAPFVYVLFGHLQLKNLFRYCIKRTNSRHFGGIGSILTVFLSTKSTLICISIHSVNTLSYSVHWMRVCMVGFVCLFAWFCYFVFELCVFVSKHSLNFCLKWIEF